MEEDKNKDNMDDSMESLPNYFLVNEEEDNINLSNNTGSYYNYPLSPSTPSSRKPYIKLKIHCKNLNNIISSKNKKSENNNNKYSVQLCQYCIIKLNEQEIQTKEIFHNSPRWNENFELEIAEESIDKIIIEVYSSGIFENSYQGTRNVQIKQGEAPNYLGFQILPIHFLEQSNQIGIKSEITLQLIPSKIEEYFNEKDSIMNIENHNPISYVIPNQNDKTPSITLIFTYYNHQALSLINCSVYSLIEREDTIQGKQYLMYKLYIKRMDGQKWFKEATIEEIESFKEEMSNTAKEIKDIPFPSKSLFSYLPIIGRFYEEEDNKSIKERIKMIDNFFMIITKNLLLYSLEEFNDFFTETIN